MPKPPKPTKPVCQECGGSETTIINKIAGEGIYKHLVKSLKCVTCGHILAVL